MLFRNTSTCLDAMGRNRTLSATNSGLTQMIEGWQAFLAFAGISVFCIFLAKLFNWIRDIIYHDQDNIDTDFNAGGKISAGLTATTIVSQWTWAATLLQSATVASKYGISGPFWYASGATVQILLFAMVSVQLKIRAPGAKTFLQVIRARFGSRTHIVFCVFALMTNVLVTAMLMLGGAAVMTNLVQGLNLTLATCMVAFVIGTYTFVGGLGATFYVSYFNTAIIFVIMLIFLAKVYHSPGDNSQHAIGTPERVFTYLSCSIGPLGNADNSYLTMLSESGLTFGIINVVGNFGTVFVDQSYWQSSVAARPKQGVWGFLSGGLVWFAVPFTFATTMGLAYISLGADQQEPLLSDAQVNRGLVPAVVAQHLLGQNGQILILIMILMAVTSTGSAEVIAVTSILVYDIHQIYLKPYRHVHDANSCILCGSQRGRNANPRDKCVCVSMTVCKQCSADDRNREESKRAIKPKYECKMHGNYRMYNLYLKHLKNWCLLWTVLSIIPLTLLLDVLQISLDWVYQMMGILVGSAVIPIALSMFWVRLTGPAMMIGAIAGTGVAIVVWLTFAATRQGGLYLFLANTGDGVSMLAGNLAAIVTGGLLTVIVTFLTSGGSNAAMSNEVWENTRDIDSPLSPWTELYARDLNLTGASRLDKRPALEDVSRAFRGAKVIAYVGALGLSVSLLIFWPAVMTAVGVMDISRFKQWINVTEAWGFIAATFIITMPLISEAADIWMKSRERRRVTSPGEALTSSEVEIHAANKSSLNSSAHLHAECSSVAHVHATTANASISSVIDIREPIFQ